MGRVDYTDHLLEEDSHILPPSRILATTGRGPLANLHLRMGRIPLVGENRMGRNQSSALKYNQIVGLWAFEERNDTRLFLSFP